ncbi:MAG TPA: hypothetical protein VMZ69_06160 [Saprospiraceae bacterium]|nr:hypothetical protein [Saprospiraceae bacterium]
MIRWCSFLLFMSLPYFGFSQISLNVRYLSGKSEILDAQNISQDGFHASAEYHLRLKEKRLEFRPGLGYRSTTAGTSKDGYFNSFDFDLGTAIYPFDFAGDCHCPTFSKDGGLFKKGFFLEVIPGVGYQILSRLRSEPNDPSKLPIRSKNINWKLGGAAGLDIGISDHFTLTPMLSATMLSASEWDGLRQDGTSANLDDYVYFGAGIRITYNAEDKKRRRN